MELLKSEIKKNISINDICGPFYKSFFIYYSVYTYNYEDIDKMPENIKNIYIYLSNYICSFSVAKYIYDEDINIKTYNNIINMYYYNNKKTNKCFVEYKKYNNLETLEKIKEYNNKLYSLDVIYPAYRLDEIINSICTKYELSYKFVESPCDNSKIVIYIINRKTEEIISILRNNENINEFSNNEDIAKCLLKYVLSYEKK